MSSITENGNNINVEENEAEVATKTEEENNNINSSKDREFDGDDNDEIVNEEEKTTIEIVKCDSKPTLVLREFDSANTETDTDTLAFCPIPVTPKKLVDSNDQNGYDNNYTGGGDDDDFNDDDYYSDEEDELLYRFLDKSNEIAEARLAARRQARAEAREIRMKELERQQKEQEQNADRVFDMQTAAGIDPLSRTRLTVGLNSSLNSVRGNSISSRRSSEDSLEDEGRTLRDFRHEVKEVEERFRKAMIANAQLDNERASQTYQISLLKDKLEEMEESHSQLQREFKEKTRENNALKRNTDKLEEELKLVQGQLNERDQLITEQGLVIVLVENEDGSDAKRALVTVENAQLLGSVQGSLDVRLKKFTEEKQQLQIEVQNLQQQLDNLKSQKGRYSNGPSGEDDDYDAQREANKLISDYKYKLQKSEQEIASLQASLARSETQVIRYKSTAEAAEKAESDLKVERRKLQREVSFTRF
ncbi:LRRFIP2 family protein [Megaselia abdita]